MREFTPQEIKKAKKLAGIVAKGNAAMVDYLLELEEKFEDTLEQIRQSVPNLDEILATIKGKDGITPILGQDYFTEEDKVVMVDALYSMVEIPKPKDGVTPVAGKDYPTRQQIEEYINKLLVQIPFPKDGKPGAPGRDGVGRPGRDGSPDTPVQVRDKLETLKDEERLDISAIKGIEQREQGIQDFILNRAVSIVDNRTSFLINKVNTLESRPAGGGTPGGSDTQVQFNDGGSFGGDADFTYNKTTNRLTVGSIDASADPGLSNFNQIFSQNGVESDEFWSSYNNLLIYTTNGHNMNVESSGILRLGTTEATNIEFYTDGNLVATWLGSNGNLGLGVTSPTAVLHLEAGTTAAGTAPLKLTSGTSMTAAEAGAVEYTTDDLFFTIATGTARKRLLMADPVGGLTSGRVPFATTNGRLTDSSTLTWNGTNLGVGVTTPASLLELQGGLTTVGSVLTLGTKEPSVVANDVLGRINFYAPLESDGGDSVLVSASIVALATATFSTTVNTTALQFQTGNSETATTKMTLSGDGRLSVGTTSTVAWFEVQNSNSNGELIAMFTQPNLTNGNRIYYAIGKGWSDTNAAYVGFVRNATDDNTFLTFGHYNADEILNVTKGRKVGINTNAPGYELDVSGGIHATDYYSSAGNVGISDTIDLTTAVSISVENGLITGWA